MKQPATRYFYIISFLLCFVSISFYKLPAQNTYTPEVADPLLEPWRWKHIDALDGKHVTSVTEDKSGNIWFGVDRGLIKYDGYRYIEYTYPDTLEHANIRTIEVTNQGVLIGNGFGFLRFNDNTWDNIIYLAPGQRRQSGKRNFNFKSFTEISDEFALGITNRGIFLLYNNAAHFYTTADTREAMEDLFPNLTFHTILHGFNYRDIFINSIIEENGVITAFAQAPRKIELTIDVSAKHKELLKVTSVKNTRMPELHGYRTYHLNAKDGSLWYSSRNPNLPVIHIKSGNVKFYTKSEIADDKQTSGLVETNDGTILIGGAGSFYAFRNGKFKQYKTPDVPISLASTVNLFKDSRDNVWVINFRSKVFLLEYHSKNWNSWPDLFYQYSNEDEMWFISRDNKAVHKKEHWYYYGIRHGMLSHPSKIIKTSRGDIWCAGSHNGKAATAYLDKNNKWVKQIHDFSWNIDKRSVFEDSEGNLWFSSYYTHMFQGPGVLKLSYNNLDTLQWESYIRPIFTLGGFVEFDSAVMGATVFGLKKVSNIRSRFGEVHLGEIMEAVDKDTKGNVWVGTRSNGVYKITPDKEITHYNIDNGLKSNVVNDLLVDNDDGIWVVTEADFSYFNGEAWTNNCFPKELLYEIEGGELSVTPDGKLWISVLSKDWSRQAEFSQKAPVSGDFFTVSYVSDKNAPQTYVDKTHDTVEYRADVYVSWFGIDKWGKTEQKDILYSWRLNDGEWSNFSAERGTLLTSLVHGKHNLQVRAKDGDFNVDPSPAEVKIVVLPPIWRRPWFVLLMVSLVLIIIVLGLRLMLNNKRLAFLNNSLSKANSQLEQQNTEIELQKEKMLKQKEKLHQLKMKFFTNISHEIRTPLTLIKGPLQQIIDSDYDVSTTKKYTGLIQKNADVLLGLVNEIMDFRKLETGHENLNIETIELERFLTELTVLFKEYSERNNIDLQLQINTTNALNADKGKLNKVLYNLILNAFKFTPEKGIIRVIACNGAAQSNPDLTNFYSVYGSHEPLKHFIEIIIEDSGVGISQDAIGEIFERFYQVETTNQSELKSNSNPGKQMGSGIGLALTKQLMLLHKGDILVNSKTGKGTRFALRFPLDGSQTNVDTSEITPNQDKNENDSIEKSLEIDIPKNIDLNIEFDVTVLLVEDNKDLLDYLKDIFTERFTVITAPNGKVGLELAKEHVPDIIISDIMMPYVSGTELCYHIKTDIATSHIPVILLSARTSVEHKLEGYQTGADAYIPKPFNKQMLEMQVDNMLLTRQRAIEKIRSENPLSIKSLPGNNRDTEFIDKVTELITENLQEEGFSVTRLSEELFMSAKTLSRKLNALTGFSPRDFIKTVRINKAVELMQTTDFTIAEISFQTGFYSSSHFSKIFKERFKITPTEFREGKPLA